MRRVILSLVAALVLAAFAMPAAAAKPEITKSSIDEVFLDEFLTETCDFDVWVTLTGHEISRVFVDAEGNFIREVFTIALHGTISAGGTTLRFVDAGMDTITALPGGGVQVAIHGNVGLVRVKGKGPVLGMTGRIVFQLTPAFDEAGNPILDDQGNQVMNVEVVADSGLRVEDLDAVCAALAPAQ